MSPKSILLIDDDVGLLRRLSAAFALKGYQVHAATDGQCGLERMVQVSPDVVVTDIQMPKMNVRFWPRASPSFFFFPIFSVIHMIFFVIFLVACRAMNARRRSEHCPTRGRALYRWWG